MRERLAAPGAPVLEEPPAGAPYPLYRYAAWEHRFPGLRVGITAVAPEADFGVTRAPSQAELRRRYGRLGAQLGFESQAVPTQVHGSTVKRVDDSQPGGLWLAGEADGLVTDRARTLCCITAADCVPTYLLDPSRRALGLVHGGWRGIAAGILEAGLAKMEREFGSAPESMLMHLGPAICGSCYEVGPEVPRALGMTSADAATGASPTAGAARRGDEGPKVHVDLRLELAKRAADRGIPAERITISRWCTSCQPDQFHSHRGRGPAAGRMAAFLGWRHGSA